jgi:hypothetical protein
VQVLMSRPREEWVHSIGSRYKALENFTQEDARLQFLRILRSLPYGTREGCAGQYIWNTMHATFHPQACSVKNAPV